MRLEVVGKVHPQQGGWTIEGVREIHFPDGRWRVALHQSSVVVLIDGDEPADLNTFVQNVRSVVDGVVDAVGFELAFPLRFELTHLIKDGEMIAFVQAGWPALRAADGSTEQPAWMDEDELTPMITEIVRVPLIRYAVADVQRAVEMPDDTAFYCYRALESLRTMFLEGEDEGAARARSWRCLREELRLAREAIDAVKVLADKRRHGGHRVLTEQDRMDCLILTRRAIRVAIERTRTSSNTEA